VSKVEFFFFYFYLPGASWLLFIVLFFSLLFFLLYLHLAFFISHPPHPFLLSPLSLRPRVETLDRAAGEFQSHFFLDFKNISFCGLPA
jgi:hypothetical protein